jgi:two-component system, NtrC family, sensor kinase
LAASLAHEINNPLAAAVGGVQLLASEPDLTENLRGRLQLIDQSLLRAGQKLRSLLLIAQGDRQPQYLPLEQLVEDLVTLSNFRAVVEKVSIVTSVEPGSVWIGSPGDLARACLYLVNNAIEACTGKTDATVMITVDRDSNWQNLRVSDNGTGIAAENKPHIFEPFFTTKGSPHNGVGLYLAAEIVHSAGGQIEFESPATNAITEFRIKMPQPAPPESLTPASPV